MFIFHMKTVSLVNQTYLNTSLKYVFGTTGDTACNVFVYAETHVICALSRERRLLVKIYKIKTKRNRRNSGYSIHMTNSRF